MKVLGTNPSSAHRKVLLVAQQPLQSCYKLFKISHSHPNIFKEVGTVLFPEGRGKGRKVLLASCHCPHQIFCRASVCPLSKLLVAT